MGYCCAGRDQIHSLSTMRDSPNSMAQIPVPRLKSFINMLSATAENRSNLLQHQAHGDTRGLLEPDAVFQLELLQKGRAGDLQYVSRGEQRRRCVRTKSFLFCFVIWQGIF